MTTKQKIARITKSIELQKKIRASIEASRLMDVSIEIIDIQSMLAQCDEMILTLEHRLGQIERRAVAFA